MCIVCGALGLSRHWAETGSDAPAQRRERRARIRLLNRILHHYGMAARLWSGGGYLVGRTGGPSQRADGLPSLWREVERATGQACDPLDPVLVAAL